MLIRTEVFDIEIDPLNMDQAVTHIMNWIDKHEYSCKYVVTPNVDHIVKLRNNLEFNKAYKHADLVLVDGKFVLLASRLLGKSLPETVPGSDLCPALFDSAKNREKIKVFLLGAAEGVADRAASAIQARWPWVEVCGVYSPPMGFSASSDSNEVAVKKINAAEPDVLVIGLGAPKQEIWIQAMRSQLKVKVALCVGATIDFLAGEKPRAPIWIRKIGFEWLFRALSEPKRLLPRYLHDGFVFPILVIREWLNK